LQWRWLFIYPQQHIATVNYFRMPVDTPVHFEITADAPMNSFWVPRLGSQVYAMPGMSTSLHLEASAVGRYDGSSANISGDGFADMRFTAEASSASDFNEWVRYAQAADTPLTSSSYAKLAQPSHDAGVHYFAPSKDNLYDTIVQKYMTPPAEHDQSGMGAMGAMQ
jgi:cytochrome o ubiquinol oxidase subunit II